MDIHPYNGQFQKVVNIIESAKECACAYRKENEELWRIYQQAIKNGFYGDNFVQKRADFYLCQSKLSQF